VKCLERSCVFPAVDSRDKCAIHLRDAVAQFSLYGSSVQEGMKLGSFSKFRFSMHTQLRSEEWQSQ
jgi:hypothetical protein